MKRKAVILGHGFIGQRIREELKYPISNIRIHNFSDIDTILKKYKPQVLINCIGHTGKSNVDDCEKALDKTLTTNTFIPTLLAEATRRHNIKLVHISSGCIYHYDYGKQSPVTETRPPDYYDLYYSRTKIYAERILSDLSKNQDILIVRIRIPLDNRPHPRNILTKLIKYKTIIDIPNSITYIPDFLKILQSLIKRNAKGIYNIALKGSLRYVELLDVYRKYRPHFQYKIIRLKDLKLIRTNLILSTKKLEKTKIKIRKPKDILEECVREYLNY